MDVKEFIATILKKFSSIPENNHKDIKPLIRVVSYLALENLKNKIVNLSEEPERSAEDVQQQSLSSKLEELSAFLREWEKTIQGTDAIYFHTPHAQMNRKFFILAEELAGVKNEASQTKTNDASSVHVYDLLLPGIFNSTQNKSMRQRFLALQLHEFLLSEDGVTLIDVAQCLDDAYQKAVFDLHHTPKKDNPLSDKDSSRVQDHSIEAARYYSAIQSKVKYEFSSPADCNEFHQAIKSSFYHVKSSYGEEGNKKLAAYVSTEIKDKSQLIEIMTQHLDKSEWKDFIDKIDDKNLFRIMLGNKKLETVIEEKNHCSGEVDRDRAILFCLTEVYIKTRDEGPKYKTMTASLADYSRFLGSYSKYEKVPAAKALQRFFASDAPLNENGLIQYLDETNQSEHKNAITQGGSLLRKICEQAPAFFPDYSVFCYLGWGNKS